MDKLLEDLERLTQPLPQREAFGARVFKVTKEDVRLTWVKVTGGELKVKAELSAREDARSPWSGKADQLRLYNGAKFQLVDTALPGTWWRVAGLSDAYPGEGLGSEPDASPPALEPVLRYRVLLPQGIDVHKALGQLRELEQEDPLLHVVWDERLGQVHLQLMGEVQLEVLQSLVERRFGWQAAFDEGGILYKETINARVEGVGHYEPLRHYAEVHLVLEPGAPGSGVEIATSCREDELAGSWQRLVLTHLAEKAHIGPLLGAPLTDCKITWRRAGPTSSTPRAGTSARPPTVRCARGCGRPRPRGLRAAGALVPVQPAGAQDCVGRALADMPRLFAEFEPPVIQGEQAVLAGRAPVASLLGYAREVSAYTKGHGQLSCIPAGYALATQRGNHRRGGV